MSHTSKTSYSTGKEENEEEIGEGEMKTKDVFLKKNKNSKTAPSGVALQNILSELVPELPNITTLYFIG